MLVVVLMTFYHRTYATWRRLSRPLVLKSWASPLWSLLGLLCGAHATAGYPALVARNFCDYVDHGELSISAVSHIRTRGLANSE